MIPAYAPYDPDASLDAVEPLSSPDSEHESAEPAIGTGNKPATRVALAQGEVASVLPWKGVSQTSVLMTLNQLAVMNQNGIEIAEALAMVASHCPNKRLAETLWRIHEMVSQGQPLSVAVSANGEHFPRTLAPMLASAEASGEVPQTLGKICRRMRNELQLRGAVLGAMIYPIILVLASLVVLTALILGVLPQFSKVFSSLGRPVPGSTQLLLDLGDLSRTHWFWMLPLVLGAVGGLLGLRKHPWIQRPLNRFLM
ncbi:MAG: type II secretion system F family protein, partial [Pirellulales bacterium]|nr:type II secretion system F family protein [Pirellulales bacterium]